MLLAMSPPRSKPTPAHQYFFHCAQCRRPITVEPNQAGARVECVCGLINIVPSLIQLERAELAQAGPAPLSVPPSRPMGQTSSYSSPLPTSGIANANPPCPFCRGPMLPGRIVGERYQLKWLGIEIPLTLGIWAIGGTPIGKGGFMTFIRPHITGWRCVPCGKIIVDERA